MCGIVGLHLRTPELYPRLGELLTGMLCEMGDRGSDSTGVAVYGDPLLSPPGRGVVSVVDVSDDADAVASAVGGQLGGDVDVVTVDATYLVSADVTSAVLLDAVKAAYPRALDRRLRRRPGGAQGRRASDGADRRMGARQGAGLAGRRTHQDGDRVRGHARGLPPLRGRTRTVHGAQRLVRQPRHHPARTAFGWSRFRQRERHRGGRALHRQAARRRPRRGVGVEGALRDVRRLLHAAGVQPGLVRRGPRRDRVQARRHRRDRRLGRHGQRIPRSGRPSRCRARRRSGSRSRR